MKKMQKKDSSFKIGVLWSAVIMLFLMNITTVAFLILKCRKDDENFSRTISLAAINNLMIENNYKCTVEHRREACDNHKELAERYKSVINPKK